MAYVNAAIGATSQMFGGATGSQQPVPHNPALPQSPQFLNQQFLDHQPPPQKPKSRYLQKKENQMNSNGQVLPKKPLNGYMHFMSH